MKYRNLGKSGLKVSEVGLGGNNFGFRLDVQESRDIIHHAVDLGVNFIDTADWYGNQGNSEEFIGQAVKDIRHKVIIATKFGFAMGKGPNDQGASRHYILRAVEASLKRLHTDYIDLYQMHRPDPDTPLEETLRTMEELIESGKVRYIGCANFNAWEISEGIWTAKSGNLSKFVIAQCAYNLLDRSIENETIPCCQTHGIGILPWGPLGGGFLTGKYQRASEAPPGSRLSIMKMYNKQLTSDNFDKLDKLREIAASQRCTLAQLSIAWLLSKPYISSVIAGATKKEHVSANIAVSEWNLDREVIDKIESICPVGDKVLDWRGGGAAAASAR